MEISFYLKRKDSVLETAIFARISYFGLQLKYYPSIKILPQHWNAGTQRAYTKKEKGYSNFKSCENFNRRLDDIARDTQDVLFDYQNRNNGVIPSTELLKTLLDSKLKEIKVSKETYNLLTYSAKFLSDSKNGLRLNISTKKQMTEGTIKTYATTVAIIKTFVTTKKKKYEFENIDLDFYNDFTTYLQKEKKLSLNTIGKHIKILKTILNEATEEGYNTSTAYKSKRFIKTQEKVSNIYLTESELVEMAGLDLTASPHLDRVRDLFLVGCYTGLRFSDFSNIKPDQIEDGYIEITPKKTKKPIVIPIKKELQVILKKYNGVLPKAISNQKTNDYIKDVAMQLEDFDKTLSIEHTKGGVRMIKNVPKYKLVSTHTARRSFATNEYKKDGSKMTILMAITGHSTPATFLNYIKVTPRENAQILKLSWDRESNQIPLTA